MVALSTIQGNDWQVVEMKKVHPVPTAKFRELSTMGTKATLGGFVSAKVGPRAPNDDHRMMIIL
jgi:hypothetical protein